MDLSDSPPAAGAMPQGSRPLSGLPHTCAHRSHIDPHVGRGFDGKLEALGFDASTTMFASTHLSPRLARLLWATALLRTRLETALDRADRYASPEAFLGAALGMADFGPAIVERHKRIAKSYQHALAEVSQATTRWTTRVSQLDRADVEELRQMGVDIDATLALVDPSRAGDHSESPGRPAARSRGSQDPLRGSLPIAGRAVPSPNGAKLARLRAQLSMVEQGLRLAHPDAYR